MATCSSCGQANADGARFCNACGAELSATAREVRKTVTVLFADVAGSTSLGESLDPESLRRVMARYFETARGCLERHGGTVEKFIGDAVMGVFGVPTVHEDDALRAVRAASDLRDSLSILNRELEQDFGVVSLQIRIGVNTGEVVTGTEERLATGDAVNVAARLEQAAQPGEILIGEQTLRLSRGATEAEPVEPLSLKGKAEPVGAYRLVRVSHDASAFERRLDAPLVGRREELTMLQAAFEHASAERRCHLVTVLGPPGIGKTRLARELSATLRSRASVLSGRCLPYGEGITYWPLVEIFRQAGAEGELADALTAGAAEDIFWSVRKIFERRARERPLALIVEDIHWAEPTLLDLLEHLVEWTRDAPLLLLCLARPDLTDTRPTWAAASRAETMTLEPLSRVESAELIDELLHDARLDDVTRARVSDAAEGNPLFVEQLLAMLAEGGDAERVPPTIQALLAARLDSLPDHEREILERASVVGLEFEWEALTELARDRRRPGGAQLAALVRKDLIRPHEAIEDTFSFRHMLIRDAAYERVPKQLRSELHERFAGWLDERDEEFDEVIGYHLERAYRCLEELGRQDARSRALAEQAAERLAGSGRRAYARADSRAAVNLLERAAALLPVSDPRRLSLLPPLGRALREQGRLDHADTVLSEAVRRGRSANEPAVAADAAVALSDLRFHRTHQTGVGRDDVLREIEEALVVFAEAGDDGGLSRALALRGMLQFWAGEAAAALPDLERAAALADEMGSRGDEAKSIQYISLAMREGPTPVKAALQRLEEMGSGPAVNAELECAILTDRAQLVARLGQFEAARDFANQAIVLGEEHGIRAATRARFAAANVELLAGDASAAENELRAVCEHYESVGELGYLSTASYWLADAVVAQGRDEEALLLTERWRADRLTVSEDRDAQSGWRRVRAKALARRGELAEAERLSREAVAIASATDGLELQAEALAVLGEVLLRAGRPEESRAALEDALQRYEAKGNVVDAERVRGVISPRPMQT